MADGIEATDGVVLPKLGEDWEHESRFPPRLQATWNKSSSPLYRVQCTAPGSVADLRLHRIDPRTPDDFGVRVKMAINFSVTNLAIWIHPEHPEIMVGIRGR